MKHHVQLQDRVKQSSDRCLGSTQQLTKRQSCLENIRFGVFYMDYTVYIVSALLCLIMFL